MNTLVMNLGNLAVTEYTTPFTGIAGDLETTASGVYAAGGDDDDGAVIEAGATFGLALTNGRHQRARYLYAWLDGGVGMKASVTTSQGKRYEYAGTERHGRVQRFVFGAGIRDNYLQVGLRNVRGKPFIIDRLEVETSNSATRRL